jgi:hypothetical protein
LRLIAQRTLAGHHPKLPGWIRPCRRQSQGKHSSELMPEGAAHLTMTQKD